MRYFFDTEFITGKGYIELVSIAIVSDDGRELHKVSNAFNPKRADAWVQTNVLPRLPPKKTWVSERAIQHAVRTFVGEDKAPQFWAYFASYDWVLFCWLFGGMLKLPKGWPQYVMDLKQGMAERGMKREHLPPKPDDAHNALADARWLREAWTVVYVHGDLHGCTAANSCGRPGCLGKCGSRG